MKLLFVTGSRGEWGYIRPLARLCAERGDVAQICATNMLLLPSHGSLIDEIERDGFDVEQKIYMSLEGNNHLTMAKSLGVFLASFVDVVASLGPDWIVLAGDRGEQLAAAVAGAYTYTPTAHIQAGERSGNIDGVARHALTKLVHVHFAANDEAGERLRRLGEEAFRVHVVGAPQLDELVQGDYADRAELEQRYGLPAGDAFLLVVQHPITEEYDRVDEQVGALADALARVRMRKVWVLPNNDAGGEGIRRGLLARRGADTYVFSNLSRRDYLGLLRTTQAIVGNSSSGLLEAPTFGVPAVNIGRRQADRVQGGNVVNVPFDEHAIYAAIEKCASADFRQSIASFPNPYGDGRSAARVLDVLGSMRRDERLLLKKMTY